MKRSGLLHPELSAVVAGLGHGEGLVIADAGLPVPARTPRIDLAVSLGVPGFLPVLDAVLTELVVEDALVARELDDGRSTAVRGPLLARLDEVLGGREPTRITHEDFKARLAAVRAVVRTGEATPFSNVLLIAGVNF